MPAPAPHACLSAAPRAAAVAWAGGREIAGPATVNVPSALRAYDPVSQSDPGRTMKHALLFSLSLLTLAACDPAQMADKAGRRAAETVVRPVVGNYLAGAQADAATRCIVENASADDVRLLARDIAVEAGSNTVANVLRIAAQPNTLACFARSGVAPLGGMVR